MAAVAERIRAKIGWRTAGRRDRRRRSSPPTTRALRGRLETRLLFGHRRRDKFDAA